MLSRRTRACLGELVRGMQDYGVHLPGTLLKTNLVNCGKDLEPQASVEEIADANLRVLRRVLPVAVASVNYLSGGLSLDRATAILSALNKLKRGGRRSLRALEPVVLVVVVHPAAPLRFM